MDLPTWLSQAPRWVSWRDLAHALSPLAPLSTVVDFLAGRHPERLEDATLPGRDPAFIAWLAELTRVLGRVFRLRLHGVANVPAHGPALLVGNHNGGLLALDSLFTLGAIADALGPERAVYPLAHDLVRYDPVAHRFAERMGILRAGHQGAARALGAGHLVLVYPGSDIDTFRPFRDRHRVELAGRMGFLRLALRERVPIIPVVSAGTHEQWIVLSRGDRLAHTLGTDRLLRTKVLPLALALPFGLTFGLLPYLPLPAQTSIAFGQPLDFSDLPPAAADDPATLARCYDEVVTAMQAILDALAAGRRPFLGQPADRRAAVDALLTAGTSWRA